MSSLWAKLKELGAGAWAALGAVVLLALALLGHSFAQDRLRAKRREADERVREELEEEAQRATQRANDLGRAQTLDREADRAAAARAELDERELSRTRTLDELGDEELAERWRKIGRRP